MKKIVLSVLAVLLVLVAVLLFTGVINVNVLLLKASSALFGYPANFADIRYSRPDVTELTKAVDKVIAAALPEKKINDLMGLVWDVYDYYYDFYTDYLIANIRYSQDLTDIFWEAEYNYCAAAAGTVDSAMERMFFALADSPLLEELEAPAYFGEGFFDDYHGESVWDETLTAMLEQEAQLENRYYTLNRESTAVEFGTEEYYTTYGSQMEGLFVELVALRQEIAAYTGYPDYPTFAYDFYYARDYTPAQAESYLAAVQTELSGLYRSLPFDDLETFAQTKATEDEVFAYVKAAAKRMGGVFADAFTLLDFADLYDITYSDNKYNASFEGYLILYREPFIFLDPSGTARDKLAFAHEFGHFCSDYAAKGSMAGVDVAEVFSQSMEYLSLLYTEDVEDLTRMKMMDSLCVFVEQSLYAAFEHQVYDLKGDDLTQENVRSLFAELGSAYGLDETQLDSRSYVAVTHFFTNPMYVFSYVVSNDAALQFYQLEVAEEGAGLQLLEQSLATEQRYFLAFLEEAGLKDPFDKNRLQAVRQTLEELLK